MVYLANKDRLCPRCGRFILVWKHLTWIPIFFSFGPQIHVDIPFKSHTGIWRYSKTPWRFHLKDKPNDSANSKSEENYFFLFLYQHQNRAKIWMFNVELFMYRYSVYTGPVAVTAMILETSLRIIFNFPMISWSVLLTTVNKYRHGINK